MVVFSCYHHDDLLYSFHLLFEHRLGWKLYRPIGLDWFNKGYWKIAKPYGDNPATVNQFLKYGAMPDDGTKPLNDYPKYADGCEQKLMSFEEFQNSPIDIVIASIPDHYESFCRLIKEHKPNAKLICHFGNVLWNIREYSYKNIMASVAPQNTPDGYNVVYYHQEFDTSVYKPSGEAKDRVIRSFVNTLATADLFREDWQTFLDLEKALPDYKFESYGASCREGVVNGHYKIARLMQKSKFGFHLKTGGDGFGHIIHQWFACGIPPIVKLEQYRGKLAHELMIDGETCIAIDSLTINEIVNKVRYYEEPHRYQNMSQTAYNVFEDVVNFNNEEIAIKKFLERLQ